MPTPFTVWSFDAAGALRLCRFSHGGDAEAAAWRLAEFCGEAFLCDGWGSRSYRVGR